MQRDNEGTNGGDKEAQAAPGGLASIFEHVRSHLRADGPGLIDGGETLPDEDVGREKQTGLRFVAGAMDGILSSHTSGEPEAPEARLAELHEALVQLADYPASDARAKVRNQFREGDPRTRIDPLLERLRLAPPHDRGRLYEEMKRFLLEGGHRNEVKFSIAILSCFCGEEDIDLFRTIGRHEEFTLYAASALARVASDPVPEWMELARYVTGWGKVRLVEMLLRDPRPEVRHFLLRYGCRNSIMHGYTALPIATTCRLHEALAAEDADRDLLSGAADILGSLADDALHGGPD